MVVKPDFLSDVLIANGYLVIEIPFKLRSIARRTSFNEKSLYFEEGFMLYSVADL